MGMVGYLDMLKTFHFRANHLQIQDSSDILELSYLDVKCPGSGMSDKNYFENLGSWNWLSREHEDLGYGHIFMYE